MRALSVVTIAVLTVTLLTPTCGSAGVLSLFGSSDDSSSNGRKRRCCLHPKEPPRVSIAISMPGVLNLPPEEEDTAEPEGEDLDNVENRVEELERDLTRLSLIVEKLGLILRQMDGVENLPAPMEVSPDASQSSEAANPAAPPAPPVPEDGE